MRRPRIRLSLVLAAIAFAVLAPPARAGASSSSRTLYQGSVKIKPVSPSKIKARLSGLGCNTKKSRCRFVEKGKTIQIFPQGPGFGPRSFELTRREISATEDVPGRPDIESFKRALRAQLTVLDGAVVLDEKSWTLAKTTYPWDVLY